MDAFAFIEKGQVKEKHPVYVLAGTERFLKRQALGLLKQALLKDVDADLACAVYAGDTVSFAQVRDDLDALPFLAPLRWVHIQDADSFVTQHRSKLERYVEQPSRHNVLILDVKTWTSTTKLAKKVPDAATLQCKAPATGPLTQWLIRWTHQQYQKKLDPAAANLLVELIGAEMGLLDQEAAKLSVYVGEQKTITMQDIDQLVGHSRMETAWVMLDALAAGQGTKALETLHHLLRQGEEPIALLGAMGWQLRRLAQVARLRQLGVDLGSALAKVGLPPFKRDQAAQTLQRLGRHIFQVYELLLATDLNLKSSDQLSPAALLERLVVKLALFAAPAAPAAAGRA